MHPLLTLLKAQLNLEHDLDDALLSHKLEVASAWTQAYLGTGEAPAAILTEAQLQLAAHLYLFREAATDMRLAVIPFGVRDLLDPYAEKVTGHVRG